MNCVYRSDVTVIIRTVGERTLGLCRHLVAQQVPENNIFVISETPFSQAVKRTFEVGLDNNLPWTLAIDADILVREGAVAELMTMAEHADLNTFEVQGKILDKLFGGPKPGGPHLFRTALLLYAVNLIPLDNSSSRPEGYTIKQMAKHNYPSIQNNVVLGLHDYEQYYHDIYRKAFVHAKKYGGPLSKQLEALWSRLAQDDPDYQVALWGYRAGKIFDGKLKLDVNHLPQEIDTLLQMQGWQEKGILSVDTWAGTEINKFIAGFKSPQEFILMEELLNGITPANDWNTRFHAILKKTGWSKILPWSVGRGLKGIGQTLQTWSES